MNKKVIAVVAAGVLAVVGVATLGLYAKQADDRAYAGAELVTVVRVVSTVPQDTSVADLGPLTKVAQVPAASVPEGAVADLSSMAGRVTSIQLEPGEVVLASRLVDPKAAPTQSGGVPRGLQEWAVSLDPQRLVGGKIEVGDRVGVVGSWDVADRKTKVLGNGVLVTRADYSDELGGQAVITLAVKADQVEPVTNAAEFGKIWLTKQNSAATTRAGEAVTPADVLR